MQVSGNHPSAEDTNDDLASQKSDENLSLIKRVRAAYELLADLVADRALLAQVPAEDRMRLLESAGHLYCPDTAQRRRLVKAKRNQNKARKLQRDQAVLAQTGIRKLRRQTVFTTPNVFPPPGFSSSDSEIDSDFREVVESQNCYICKRDYPAIDHFYDQLCPPCADLNFRKRTELADLRGRVALLTGGRVKIGYQTGLKLLRCGAQLIVTTRFPRDSAARYAREPDFDQWADRLEIFGLDLRHTPSVEAFCQHLFQTRSQLDFIINNACQTVRRPPEFYQHMMACETAVLEQMPPAISRLLGAFEALRGSSVFPMAKTVAESAQPFLSELGGLTHPANFSQIPLLPDERSQPHLFPEGFLDQDLQQLDLRDRNSWRFLMAEVPTVELLEVQLVNAVAPFIINARLKALLQRTPARDKHIVNVSAVEGQFYRKFKTTRHPHTNMAKAALNMMTRTSAADYYSSGIHMNSVDTGWVTDEDPAQIAQRKADEHRFHPPLDIIDGAARIVEPIISGFNTGEHVWGKFLKDYRSTDW